MNEHKKWHARVVARDMVQTLTDKGYDAHYAEELGQARELLLSMIPSGASVALGGSETLAEMDLMEHFRKGEYAFFDRYQPIPFEETVEIYRQSLLADFFITGTNAVTRNGELVNVDSTGNRVAAMIFGPKRVIVITGTNKVVNDIAAAFRRIKQIAPINAKRVGHKTPCAVTGKCVNSESVGCACGIASSICNSVGIVSSGLKFPGRISVIMVAEETGF